MVNLDDLKLPPHNVEAEKWVIGCVLINNDSMHELEEKNIEANDFYTKNHQDIYRAIEKLWRNSKNIDVVTLSNVLDKRSKLHDIGWQDYLYNLSTFVVTTTLLEDYADILKEKSNLRYLSKMSQNVLSQVDDWEESENIISNIINKAQDIQKHNCKDSIFIWDIVSDRFEEYIKRTKWDTDIEGVIQTGYFDEELSGGLEGWQLVIVAARPAMGKTSLMMSMALHNSINHSVGIVSLEMPRKSIGDRAITQLSNVPMSDIKKGNIDEQDLEQISKAWDELQDRDIHIADSTSQRLSSIRKFLNSNSLDILYVDYLQLMTSDAENRTQEVSNLSRWLKKLAMEFDIPIVALSQLSRAVENRPNKHPQLSDLRNSGSIEQDADIVLMLYREEYYDPDTDRKWITDILIRKNRNGATGSVPLEFQQDIMKFKTK